MQNKKTINQFKTILIFFTIICIPFLFINFWKTVLIFLLGLLILKLLDEKFYNKFDILKGKYVRILIIIILIFLIIKVLGHGSQKQNIQEGLNNSNKIIESVAVTTSEKNDKIIKNQIITTTGVIEKEEVGENNKQESYLVTRVIDGDTIEIEGGQKVRYIGIDTPETVDPRKPVQCFGVEASNYNKQLVEGKRVILEKDVSETDKYGRLLRYVYIDGVFVNLKLVQDGYASSYSYPPDIKYQDLFLEAQQVARKEGKGLWGKCQDVDDGITTTTITNVNKSDCTIKGNISSSGEKIYHVMGCGSYSKTKIDEARGERWFCTEDEALSAGWRKAKNCP